MQGEGRRGKEEESFTWDAGGGGQATRWKNKEQAKERKELLSSSASLPWKHTNFSGNALISDF